MDKSSLHSPKIARMLQDIPRSLSLLVVGAAIAGFAILAVVLLFIPSPGGGGCMGSYIFRELLGF